MQKYRAEERVSNIWLTYIKIRTGFLCIKDLYIKRVFVLCDLILYYSLHLGSWALPTIPAHSVIVLFLDWGDGNFIILSVIPAISPSWPSSYLVITPCVSLFPPSLPFPVSHALSWHICSHLISSSCTLPSVCPLTFAGTISPRADSLLPFSTCHTVHHIEVERLT